MILKEKTLPYNPRNTINIFDLSLLPLLFSGFCYRREGVAWVVLGDNFPWDENLKLLAEGGGCKFQLFSTKFMI